MLQPSSGGRRQATHGMPSDAEQPISKRPRVESKATENGAGGADVAASDDSQAAAAPAASASANATAAPCGDAPGVLLTCEREVSGRYRKEIFGLLHRAASALGSKFSFSAARLDGSPSVLFIACHEDSSRSDGTNLADTPAASSSSCRDCAEAPNGKCGWCAPAQQGAKVGVDALVERVCQSIGRAELSRPASPALIRLIPIQMRVQPGSLDVRASFVVKVGTTIHNFCI